METCGELYTENFSGARRICIKRPQHKGIHLGPIVSGEKELI